jgi:hypothetical protein
MDVNNDWGGSGGGGGLVPLVSMPVLIPFVDLSLSVPSGEYGSSRSTPQMELPVPTDLDVPASLDLSIVDLSLRMPLLIGISPPDMRARRLSSSGAHLVKIFGPEGEVPGGRLLVVGLVLCLSHHRVQDYQGHRGLGMSVC